MGRIFVLIAAALTVPVVASADSPVGLGAWNTYLEHQVYVECSSLGEPVTIRVAAYSNGGGELGAAEISIPANGTRHVSVNALAPSEAYGTYKVTALEGSAKNLSCHSTTYRFRGDQDIEYGFSLPLISPVSGTTAGIYNSYNPTGAPQPVANWLSIINLSNEVQSYQVQSFGIGGEPDASATLQVSGVQPGERRDVSLVSTEGYTIGAYRLTPLTDGTEYGAFVTRYATGTRSGEFAYAFPLLSSSPSCSEQVLSASTMGNALNWLEIANVGDQQAVVALEIRRANGELLYEDPAIAVGARQQLHVPLHEYLGPLSIGFARVSCTNGYSQGVIAQAAFYGRSSAGELDWAYASQGTLPFSTLVEGTAIIPVNTHLEASNWLKVPNTAESALQLGIELFEENGAAVDERSFTVSAASAIDVGLHEIVGQGFIGLAAVEETSQGSSLKPEILRVFPGSSPAEIGYIFNIPGSFTTPFARKQCALTYAAALNYTPGQVLKLPALDEGHCAYKVSFEIVEYPTVGTLYTIGSSYYYSPVDKETGSLSYRICVDFDGEESCGDTQTLVFEPSTGPAFNGDEESLEPYAAQVTSDELKHLIWKLGLNAQRLLDGGGGNLFEFVDDKLLNENLVSDDLRAELEELRDDGIWFHKPNLDDPFITIPPEAQSAERNDPIPIFSSTLDFSNAQSQKDGVDQYLAVGSREYHPTIHKYYWSYKLGNAYVIFRGRYMNPTQAVIQHLLSGHFGTSLTTIDGNQEHFLGHYFRTIERETLGNFRSLMLGTGPQGCAVSEGDLPGILCDTGSNRWLDNQLNTGSTPNENFGRELMELYLLGPVDPVTHAPNYSDQADVQASTRFVSGFTGAHASLLHWDQSRHSTEQRTMFADLASVYPDLYIENENLTPSEFVSHLFEHHPSLPRFIARKVFSMLVYPDPSDALIEELAFGFKQSGYDLHALIRRIAVSQAMFSQRAAGRNCVSGPWKVLAKAINGLNIPLFTNQGTGSDNPIQSLVFLRTWSNAVAAAGERVIGYPSVFSYDYCGRDEGKDGSTQWLKATLVVNKVKAFVTFLNEHDRRVGQFGSNPRHLRNLIDSIPRADPEAGPSVDEVIEFLLARFNLKLDPAEKELLTEYMTHSRNPTTGDLTELPWDGTNKTAAAKKIAGLIVILGNHPLMSLE